MDQLDDLLLGMGETDREALLLRYVEGRSHEEVAEALGISRAAAQKRSERALERLRLTFRSGITAGGVAALLAPPVAEAAELAQRITGPAVSAAAGAKTLPFFTTQLAGALWGAAAAITLSAVPLAMAWRDKQVAPSPPPAKVIVRPVTAAGPLTGSALPRPPQFQSAEEVVTALLALADRYGLGEAATGRSKAMLATVPREWIHDVLMGLDRRMPSGSRGTTWHNEVGESLAAHWKPRRVPEDLFEAWKALPVRYSEEMFLACAEADLPATLRYIRGRGTERARADVPYSAVIKAAIKSAPNELPALLDSSPRLEFIGYAYEFAGMAEIREAAKDPALRRTILDLLPAMKDSRRRLMVERLVLAAEPLADRMAKVEAIEDSGRRAVAATAAAAMTDESLRWWEQQVPRDQQPALGAIMAEAYMRPEVMLPWLERMGEPAGGPEFDKLRALTAQHHDARDGAPYAQVADIANRITDPVRRIAVVGTILRHGYNKGNWKPAWMEKNLTPEEREAFTTIAGRPFTKP